MAKILNKKILLFLFLTFSFSSIFYYLGISGSFYSYNLYIMWCPGIAAMITQLIFTGSLRGIGWRAGKFKYWLWSYGLTVMYGTVVYGLVWITGLGKFVPFDRVMEMVGQMNLEAPPIVLLVLYIFLMGTVGVVINMIGGLGEEIGWRGLLVPELAREHSFTITAIISGVIWALWHSPFILFSDYNNTGASTWYGLACFAVYVVGSSFAYTWLRLKSGSVWTAVIFHAAQNAFIQGIFTPLTGNTGPTPYIIDEFGVGLALSAIVVAYLFWRKRGELSNLKDAAEKVNQSIIS